MNWSMLCWLAERFPWLKRQHKKADELTGTFFLIKHPDEKELELSDVPCGNVVARLFLKEGKLWAANLLPGGSQLAYLDGIPTVNGILQIFVVHLIPTDSRWEM